MELSGSFPIRTQLVINGTTTEKESHFQYLGCDIFYEKILAIN